MTWACFDHGLHLSSGRIRGVRFDGLNSLKRVESVFWERGERTGTPICCNMSKCDALPCSVLQRGVGWCSRCDRV